MKYNTVILGAGLSGLIAGHYINSSIIIEKTGKVGGNFLDKAVPKYLHNNKIVRGLFEELDIEPELKKLNIGIYYNNYIHSFNEKKLGIQPVIDYSLKTKNKLDLKSMNRYLINKEKNYISNDKDLIYALSDIPIFLNEEIIGIDVDNHIVITKKYIYEYNKLISTIPISIFNKLLEKNIDYKTIYNRLVITAEHNHNLNGYNFIYFPDKKYLFNRITINNSNILTFEFPRCYSINESMMNILKFLRISAVKVKKYKYIEIPILQKEIILPDVLFLGRFAEGNYSLRIGDIIEKIRNIT